MAHRDFFISGDHADARTLLESIVAGAGYTLSDLPNGGRRYDRGSKQKTIWLGILAGGDFWCWFAAQYFTGPHGEFIARVSSNDGQGLLGGVWGVAKAGKMYDELAARIGAELHAQGRLLHTVNA